MNGFRRVLGLFILAGVLGLALGAAKKGKGDGLKPMFNGKDLEGWQTTGNWQVEEGGVIKLTPRPGEKGWQRYDAYLTTTHKYKDYVIDLDFKIEKDGNSGVFCRIADPKQPVKTGFEVQIIDTYGKENLTAHDCGGIVSAAAPTKNMLKKPGEWNHYTITCKGARVTVVFNGEQVVDLEMDKSKIADRPLEGYIGFQDEAKPIWYKNVRIKELK